MKYSSIKSLAVAALLAVGTSAQAESGFIASLGGGVGFGYGDNSGNSGLIDAELGYEWDDGDGVATAFVLAADFASLDQNYIGPRGRPLLAGDDVVTLAPRVRVTFPLDEVVGFYIQGQVGVNLGDSAMEDFGWGTGAGLNFKLTEALNLRLGYLVIGDFEGQGYHGALGAVTFKF
jgi:opacity protein-like surface antigen